MRVDRTSSESCGGLVGHDDRQVELVRDGVQLLHGRMEHAVRGPRWRHLRVPEVVRQAEENKKKFDVKFLILGLQNDIWSHLNRNGAFDIQLQSMRVNIQLLC